MEKKTYEQPRVEIVTTGAEDILYYSDEVEIPASPLFEMLN